MFLVMLSLGLFKKLVWLLWGVIDDLSPLGFVREEEIFCVFALWKDFVHVVSSNRNLLKMHTMYYDHINLEKSATQSSSEG